MVWQGLGKVCWAISLLETLTMSQFSASTQSYCLLPKVVYKPERSVMIVHVCAYGRLTFTYVVALTSVDGVVRVISTHMATSSVYRKTWIPVFAQFTRTRQSTTCTYNISHDIYHVHRFTCIFTRTYTHTQHVSHTLLPFPFLPVNLDLTGTFRYLVPSYLLLLP